MADYEYYGLDPGGFHRTNVLFHVVNSLLFFAFIYRATGSPWKSLFASALWALHPMRVESVAWITERKDMVSGLFFLLCLHSYLQYVKEKKPFWFMAALLMMLLGYGAKPILVIVPVILLLVDFWPLGRFGREGESQKRILLEKIPFIMLSIILSYSTVALMNDLIPATDLVSVENRFVYMITSLTYHLGKEFWPYPLFMRDFASTTLLTGIWFFAAILLLLTISFVAWKTKYAVPAFLAGWLWYLTAIFPVSGITPFGKFLLADHFTYLPHMGICMLVVWSADYLVERRPQARKSLAAITIVLIGAISFLTHVNLAYWKDGLTFFTHQAELEENSFTLKGMGVALSHSNRQGEAIKFIEKALQIQPQDADIFNKLGVAIALSGRPGEAVKYFEESLRLDPQGHDSHYNMALALFESGEGQRAESHFIKSIEMDPDKPDARHIYANLLLKYGRKDEAIIQYRELLRINPDDLRAQKALGELAR
jgi:hypothetical protein